MGQMSLILYCSQSSIDVSDFLGDSYGATHHHDDTTSRNPGELISFSVNNISFSVNNISFSVSNIFFSVSNIFFSVAQTGPPLWTLFFLEIFSSQSMNE